MPEFESFPDSEGIKTPPKRALICGRDQFESFPDSEGIKTLRERTTSIPLFQFESFPDSEGIKTRPPLLLPAGCNV